MRPHRASAPPRSPTPPRRYRPAMSTMATPARSERQRHPQSWPRLAADARVATSDLPQRLSHLRSLPASAGAVDQQRRTEAGQDIDQPHLAAAGFDDLVANHLLAGIVGALYQNLWPDLRDQLDRRVLLEQHDQIDLLVPRSARVRPARGGRL